MTEFCDEHRCCRILKAESKADYCPSTGKHGEAVGEGLQEHAQDDDHRPSNDGEFPSNFLDQPPEEELGNDAAQSLSSVEDSELSSSGIAEVGLPVGKCLHAIHDAAIETVCCLDDEHNTKPSVQIAKMFVLIPRAIEEFLHVNCCVATASASNNLVLLCHVDSKLNMAKVIQEGLLYVLKSNLRFKYPTVKHLGRCKWVNPAHSLFLPVGCWGGKPGVCSISSGV